MTFARPLILATTLAALLACGATAQTQPADAAAGEGTFDATMFPWNGDLSKLTPEQRRQVIVQRARDARDKRAGAKPAEAPGRATLPAQTQPAAAGDEAFDAAMFPWDGDLSKLTSDQRRQVVVRRARDAMNKRADAKQAKAGGRAATTAPVIPVPRSPDEYQAAVAALADPDPLVRSAARDALMSVDAAALPSLREALADVTLNPVQAAGLRDAVVQSYLAGKHRFAGIGSPGYLGVAPAGDENGAAIVGSRVAGWDGFRVLRDGDAVVGIRRDAQRDPDVGFTPVPSFAGLKQLLAGTHPGDWVALRVLRDGAPIEVHARLAMQAQFAQDIATGANKFIDEADGYWQREFVPALHFAPLTTRPVE